MKYLTAGYVKSEYLKDRKNDDYFEIALLQVISKFIGNFLVIFDSYPVKCKNLIFKNGKIFKCMKINQKQDKFFGDITFGCPIKWCKGEIHQISFKSYTMSHARAPIGISTNITKLCEETGWYSSRADCVDAQIFVKNGSSFTSSPYIEGA